MHMPSKWRGSSLSVALTPKSTCLPIIWSKVMVVVLLGSDFELKAEEFGNGFEAVEA